ncbi:unnamed protein product [Lampetra fluviatilis]
MEEVKGSHRLHAAKVGETGWGGEEDEGGKGWRQKLRHKDRLLLLLLRVNVQKFVGVHDGPPLPSPSVAQTASAIEWGWWGSSSRGRKRRLCRSDKERHCLGRHQQQQASSENVF